MSRRPHAIVTVVLATLFAIGLVDEAQTATKYYERGDRLAAYQIHATSGDSSVISFERPSIIVLWATWSPASLTALDELLEGAPKGGIRWQVIPINVDAPVLNAVDTARVHAAAKTSGWNGPVWYDRGYSLMTEWGVLAIPTVAVTALGGTIDEIEHDWSPVLRDRLFALYFGALTDSFPGFVSEKSTEVCRKRAMTARWLWRIGKRVEAVASMQAVADSCSDLPNDVARLANWKWSLGGSMRRESAIRPLVEHDDASPWTSAAHAGWKYRQGDREGAIVHAERATELDSAFYPAWIQLAEFSESVGDSGKAVRAFTRAAQLNRFDGRALVLGARLAQSRGDLAEANRLLRSAVEARLGDTRP